MKVNNSVTIMLAWPGGKWNALGQLRWQVHPDGMLYELIAIHNPEPPFQTHNKSDAIPIDISLYQRKAVFSLFCYLDIFQHEG